MIKKSIALVLATVLATAVLAGCGKTEEQSSTSTPTSTAPSSSTVADNSKETSTEAADDKIELPFEETMTWSVLSPMCGNYYTTDNLTYNYMLEQANVKFELTEIANSEMGEKGNLIMTSGEYPEVLLRCNSLDLDALGMEGILIPLEDLIREYMPTLTQILDERNGWSSITAGDGHVYSLPNVQDPLINLGTTRLGMINQAWLDKVGLPMPTNMEEMYEVLKAFKEQDVNGNGNPDDEIPFGFCAGRQWMFSYYMDGVLSMDTSGQKIAMVNGEVVYYPTSDTFKEWLEWMAKFYKEGLIDPNGFTLTSAQYEANAKTDDALYGIHFDYNQVYFNDKYYEEYVGLPSFNEEGFGLRNGLTAEGLALTDKCENVGELLTWADTWYTEEGGRYFRLGIEGVTYKVNADGTYSTILPEGLENHAMQAAYYGSGMLPCRIPELFNHPNPADNAKSAYYKADMYGENGVLNPDNAVIMVSPWLTEEGQEAVTELKTLLNNYADTYMAEVITGVKSLENTWQEYLDSMEKMGVKRYEEAYKEGYKRAVAN